MNEEGIMYAKAELYLKQHEIKLSSEIAGYLARNKTFLITTLAIAGVLYLTGFSDHWHSLLVGSVIAGHLS